MTVEETTGSKLKLYVVMIGDAAPHDARCCGAQFEVTVTRAHCGEGERERQGRTTTKRTTTKTKKRQP